MKVSREGIVLIKSFEGFRPRAIRREDGGWVIGYGHTLSAREGATVSEADAELLLRYDLLPVEKTVNRAGSAVLNQHQFDALTSFAFSVGVDRFQTSDVLAHLTQGAIAQAADALMGWPEPVLPQTGLRRRAAERALFVADPDAPVAVSDLLVAPVSEAEAPPAEPHHAVVPPTTPATAAPVEQTFAVPPPAPEPDPAATLLPRDVAVSALLGEVQTPPFAVEPGPEGSAAAPRPQPADAVPSAANDTEAEAVAAIESLAPVDEGAPEPRTGSAAEPQPEFRPISSTAPEPEPQGEPRIAADAPAEHASEPHPAPAPQPEPQAQAQDLPAPHEEAPQPSAPDTPDRVEATTVVEALSPAPTIDASALAAQRYAPYSAPMVGPLPFLPPASDPGVPLAPAPAPAPLPSMAADAVAPVVVETPAAEPEPLEETPVIQPFTPTADVEPLVLSAPDDAPLFMAPPQAWSLDERQDAAETADGGLFGEELSLTQGGAPIMRHGDIEVARPASFDWSETGAFVIMGAVGLTAFGAAMAAFRLASEQSGGNETTIIAWVLAVIGAGCVGVSSFNLYRRWGLPGGDN